MKSLLTQTLAFCLYASSIVLAITTNMQSPLTQPSPDRPKVPGHNNATYGPIPTSSQLMTIEFLEIAPLPIIADQTFFLLLRATLPPLPQPPLKTATLTLTLTALAPPTTPPSPPEGTTTYTIPLRTTAYAGKAYLAIRNAHGTHVEFLQAGGRNDVLVDTEIPGFFLRTGWWRLGAVGRVGVGGEGEGEGECLFAVEMVQWLEGKT